MRSVIKLSHKNKMHCLLNTLIFVSLYTLCISCDAKKLYKYQDKQGRWHYTDQAPSTTESEELDIEIRQISVEAKQRVWLKQIGKKRKPEFVIRNDFFGPIEVEIVFTRHENVRSTPALPKKFVLAPGVSQALFSLGAIDEYQSWQYSLSYRYSLGKPHTHHDSQASYYPPFVSYKNFRISQSFNGQFSHTGEGSRYAVDLAMPEGSEVHAARAGVVMSLENDFFKGGVDRQAYKARANSIRILHDDGSMAVYAHLQVDRAQVYEGMHVKAGQLIAYSGNTGFSTGPHLHFSVQVNQGMRLVSVPFKFTDKDGKASPPKVGELLKGFVMDQ